jgi:hypothetical protein
MLDRVLPILSILFLPAGCAGVSRADHDRTVEELEFCRGRIAGLKLKNATAAIQPPPVLRIPENAVEDTSRQPPRKGTLKPEVIVDAMKLLRFPLKVCYEFALKRDAKLEKKIALKLAFQINPNGRATRISITPALAPDLLTACFETAISSFSFPRFEGKPIGIETPLTLTHN